MHYANQPLRNKMPRNRHTTRKLDLHKRKLPPGVTWTGHAQSDGQLNIHISVWKIDSVKITELLR